MLKRSVLTAATIAFALTAGACSNAVSGGSATKPTPSIALVKIPSENLAVKNAQLLQAKSKAGKTPQWSTAFQVLPGHPKYNAQVQQTAQQLVEEVSSLPYSELKLSSTLPVVAGDFICQRLAASSKAKPGTEEKADAPTQSADQPAGSQSPQPGQKKAAANSKKAAPETGSEPDQANNAADSPAAGKSQQRQNSRTLCTKAGKDKLISSGQLLKLEKAKELTRLVAQGLAEQKKLDLDRLRSQTADTAVEEAPDFSSQKKAAQTLPANPELFHDVLLDKTGGATVVLPAGVLSDAAQGQLAVHLDGKKLKGLLSATGQQISKQLSAGKAPAKLPSGKPDVSQLKAIDLDEMVDCSKEKCVALTYDDGPGPNTHKLLDTLQRENVPASFLIVGKQAKQHPDILKREAAEGHSLGCHTWDHPQLSKLAPAQVDTQITQTIAAINQAVPNYQITYTRPPYGDGAFGRGNPMVIGELKKLNQAIIIWDVDTLDWKHRDPNQVIANIKKMTHPGSIILMHDIHDASIDAAPTYIRFLKEQGYKFVTIPQLYRNQLEPGKRYFDLHNVKQ